MHAYKEAADLDPSNTEAPMALAEMIPPGISLPHCGILTSGGKVMAKRILAPLGTREADQAVLPLVATAARDSGATVRLLRVYPIPHHIVGSHGRTVAYVDQETDSLSGQGVLELEAIADTTLAGVPVETVVRFGEPAVEILTEAEAFGADLIALTTTKRNRLRRALIGSTADDVTRKAPVPTLVLTA